MPAPHPQTPPPPANPSNVPPPGSVPKLPQTIFNLEERGGSEELQLTWPPAYLAASALRQALAA
jgi:hypothetical protein